MLLLEGEATVTVTHIETRNLPDIARAADVIVAAAGAPRRVRGYWVKPRVIVIVVSITRIVDHDGTARLAGNCATNELDHAEAGTPVPGGVGPMTIACLLSNTVKAAEPALNVALEEMSASIERAFDICQSVAAVQKRRSASASMYAIRRRIPARQENSPAS